MAEKKEATEEISEDELDQIIQDMSEGEEADPPAKAHVLEVVQEEKISEPESYSSSQQSLSMEMNGVLNLKLTFKNGERFVELTCSEDELVCRMADGTEFRIPTGNAKARKAA